MSARVLARVSLAGGTYRGLLSGGEGAPGLSAECAGEALPVTVAPEGDGWRVEVDLSALRVAEGTRTVRISEGGDVLDALSIVAGLDPGADLRAEVDLLRAELDLLKDVVRRLGRRG